MAGTDVLYVAGSLEDTFPCTQPHDSEVPWEQNLLNNYMYTYIRNLYCHLLSHYVPGTTYFMCLFSFNVNTVIFSLVED